MNNKSAKKEQPSVLEKRYPKLLLGLSSLGLLASFALTIDKFHLLENPGVQLNCDINPVVSCGSVIATDQASAFGLPNPVLGIAGFAALITVAVVLLAGAEIKKAWFWKGIVAGTVFGVVFVHWLIFQTIFRIGALCPWCMVTWVSVIPMFLYTLLYVYEQKLVVFPASLSGFMKALRKDHLWVLAGWFLLIVAVILQHFWYYWKTLLP